MQQEMTIKHDNLEVQGIWGQATNPIEGAAPLVMEPFSSPRMGLPKMGRDSSRMTAM